MSDSRKFGTFLGVYLPSILTILGLIMYLRFGWVVGNLGLGLTILVVCLASSITFITGLSASAIATNIQVGVGGEYFLVSRSLGLEAGGAIGIPLYLCRTLSVTFYCFGLAEALMLLWPIGWGTIPGWCTQALAAFFIVFVTLLSGKSANLVLRMQIPIMILVGLSILALVFGVFTNELQTPEMTPSYRTAPEGFWYVFAVFFPAVTGFTAGVGMSGDLKDPRKSIPKGTLGAVVTGLIIYVFIPIILAVSAILTLDELASRDAGLEIWTKIAIGGAILVYPAVWGAILSSAFGSILGGPRVLQALSQDGLAPKFLSKLSKTGQPTKATWISGVIALVAVLLGDLNTVAQFVSVLFLTLYVAINMSAAIEKLVAEPSYRPKINVPWFVSMLGAMGAICVMFLINPIACGLAFLLEIAILVFLRSRALKQQWGDVAAGFWARASRYSMLQLSKRKILPRNWRPIILVFVRDIKARKNLVRLAEWFGQDRGILSISTLIKKDKDFNRSNAPQLLHSMHEDLKELGMEAFCEVNPVDGFFKGISQVSEGHGLGNLKSNTIMFGWSEDAESQLKQVQTIAELSDSGKNVILTRLKHADEFQKKERIDLWWGGKESNGDLMLLLAHLLTLNVAWAEANVHIKSAVKNEEEKKVLEHRLHKLIPRTRINASIQILIKEKEETFQQILHRESYEADLVFLGLMKMTDYQKNVDQINLLSKGFRAVVMVQNNNVMNTIPVLLRLD